MLSRTKGVITVVSISWKLKTLTQRPKTQGQEVQEACSRISELSREKTRFIGTFLIDLRHLNLPIVKLPPPPASSRSFTSSQSCRSRWNNQGPFIPSPCPFQVRRHKHDKRSLYLTARRCTSRSAKCGAEIWSEISAACPTAPDGGKSSAQRKGERAPQTDRLKASRHVRNPSGDKTIINRCEMNGMGSSMGRRSQPRGGASGWVLASKTSVLLNIPQSREE